MGTGHAAHELQSRTPERSPVQVLEALDRFLVQLEADGRSEHTRSQYRRHVRLLARWLASQGHSGEVRDLGHEDLARFLASPAACLRPDGAPKMATAMNALRSSLRVFFRFLAEAGYAPTNPARLIRHAVTSPPPPRALANVEEERLLGALEKAVRPDERRDAVLFQLLLRTGLRLSSALEIDVEDVDLDEGVVRLRQLKNGRGGVSFLDGQTGTVLQQYVNGRCRGPLFRSRGGLRLSARHAQRRFRHWREVAQIPGHVTVHSLRHTFAQALLSRTGDLALVREALHHSSLSSTLRYVGADEKRLRAAVRG